jgi:hypothetical protein
MTWFGGTFANTTLYIIKGDPPNEVGTAIGPCKKVKGKYQVIPCVRSPTPSRCSSATRVVPAAAERASSAHRAMRPPSTVSDTPFT